MKALTVKQPWAWAIIHAGKTVENRTQAWTYRGPLAIHSALQNSDHHSVLDPRIVQARTAAGHLGEPQRRTKVEFGGKLPDLPFPRGVIIGVVDLVGCHVAGADECRGVCPMWADFDPHRRITHLELANPRPLAEPIPARGALGLWELDATIANQLRRLT